MFEHRELRAHTHTFLVFLVSQHIPSVAFRKARCCQLSAHAGGLQPPLTPTAASGSLFQSTMAQVCYTKHCARLNLLLLSCYSKHRTIYHQGLNGSSAVLDFNPSVQSYTLIDMHPLLNVT